jgi:transcriptional regulator GlxA family with amidase domain
VVATGLDATLGTLRERMAGLPAVAAFANVLEALLHARVAAPLAQHLPATTGTLQSSEAITRIGEYLAQHLHERLSLQQIADAACLSVPTMCRLFRQGTGHSVFGYMRELRLSRVKWQLAWTDRTILNIAYNSGYESEGSFYRAFREATGVSPAAYRRSIKKGINRT